ncbi:MAG: adenosylmethionine decarboxylase [Candidatus Hydrothermia bacterium]
MECSGCSPDVIGSVDRVQAILLEAAARAGAQVWGVSVHRFPPNGVSGVVVISESHLSVHTWPERGYAALDIYTCGSHTKPMDAVMYVLSAFGAGTAHITEIERGLDDNDRIYYHSITTWEE